ncbi:MAG: DNA ligase D [Agriterribacter sp.]
MGLTEYKHKRKLNKTPEPAGGRSKDEKLQFVIQKHKASHLHYDFRLEVRGVLKSWAVPKGPSTDPSVKRLAMLVEDHPYDYKDFEGIIPPGNYGAGTVIVWDSGTYEPVDVKGDKKTLEKEMLKQFHSGAISINMHGKKLKGRYSLRKIPARGENSWLLVKGNDSYKSKTDVTKKDTSVVSGHTIESMSGNADAPEWQSNRSSTVKKKTVTRKTSLKNKGTRSSMPAKVSPMLCTLVKEPIANAEYLHEIKWDGYRIISYVNKGKVKLDSRSALDYTAKYPPIVTALQQLKHNVVLDGEAVVFNNEGMPDFDALQKYNGHNTRIHYCLFDILWLDGKDLTQLPLTERKEILQTLIAGNETLKFSESYEDGPALYEQVLQINLEGIVSKRKDSTYNQGERANDWLKVPTRKRQEFVIGGWAESDRARSFKSLLFGAYNKGKFEWIGRSGGGYKQKEMPGILKQLQALEIKESPFANKVLDTKGAKIHWVKPKLVANFEFATWTKSGRIRKPATFLGFRKDKAPGKVVREIPVETKVVEEEIEEEKEETLPKKTTTKRAASGSNWYEIEKIPITSKEKFDIGDCTIDITNVERHIWKDVTKAELIQYYHSVAKYMLPHLKDRPLSLQVRPYGATAPVLHIKDMEKRQPECADIFTDHRRHKKEGKPSTIDYLVCNNEATLLYMVNLGCIDINPWMSRVQAPDKPDFINIDLDPTDDDFKKVIEVAQAGKQVLDEYKLKGFPKTSGKTGLHIYVPVTGINNARARNVVERLSSEIHDLVPKISTINVSINSRGNKVFVDPSQNDYADTLACAYSARPFKLPTVSTPLEWKEIKPSLTPEDFTIHTIGKRLQKKGDLFAASLDDAIAQANMKRLVKVFS